MTIAAFNFYACEEGEPSSKIAQPATPQMSTKKNERGHIGAGEDEGDHDRPTGFCTSRPVPGRSPRRENSKLPGEDPFGGELERNFDSLPEGDVSGVDLQDPHAGADICFSLD